MAPLPVISDVFRVTLNWNRVNSVQPVNVMNVLCTGGTEAQVAAAFNAHVTSNMFQAMSTAQIVLTYDVIKLDGTSATHTFTQTGSAAGGSTGQTIPAVAALVSFKTAHRGPQGRGRLYAGPISEVAQDGGALDPTVRTSMQSAWTAFVTAMLANSPVVIPGIASYKHATFNQLSGVTVESPVATQRRRQDQLR
jgi:hypothetical protein